MASNWKLFFIASAFPMRLQAAHGAANHIEIVRNVFPFLYPIEFTRFIPQCGYYIRDCFYLSIQSLPNTVVSYWIYYIKSHLWWGPSHRKDQIFDHLFTFDINEDLILFHHPWNHCVYPDYETAGIWIMHPARGSTRRHFYSSTFLKSLFLHCLQYYDNFPFPSSMNSIDGHYGMKDTTDCRRWPCFLCYRKWAYK